MSRRSGSFRSGPVSVIGPLEMAADRFAAEWQAGRSPRIEDYLAEVPDGDRALLLQELLVIELSQRHAARETVGIKEFEQRFPEFKDELWIAFQMALADGPGPQPGTPTPPAVSLSPGETPDESSQQKADTDLEDGVAEGRRVGRYRVLRELGAGHFGTVYQAYDADLDRNVAIKLPHPHRVQSPEDARAYLDEARVLAQLSHPGIVRVYDVDRTPDGLPFMVSEFVDGSNLRGVMRSTRLGHAEIARIVAAVADALHYAHQKGVVHRDIKPANLLVDLAGKVYVADFGIALKEEDFGKGLPFVGTPVYMSPEQARCEGHRVDGRSDIYSLGIVFYELLTGRRPYRGDSWDELKEEIIAVEARPPRQVDDTIPAELERTCLKALSKAVSQRYTTAKDLADDLRAFLQPAPVASYPEPVNRPAGETPVVPDPAPAPRPSVVPRGLRSFDADDAGFFLDLLPGPRDREGLPESIRFWKARIEQPDPQRTFPVGLIYGPSGCGKSSVVKAGLLPRLARSVTVVHVEATATDTPGRLLGAICKARPGVPAGTSLDEVLGSLRRGRGLGQREKVLIVLDQFEQWLHRPRDGGDELVDALRQCDGARVQCLLLVRDDFWMAATRFMRALDVPLREGENCAAVDLFDPRHAKAVLTLFGRAYGALPPEPAAPTADQSAFLDQAIAALAQDGKVTPVRLAVFAEMVKGRAWAPVTLKALGGMQGVGVTFLQESFDGPTASPTRRLHQRAARAVLAALLPEPGSEIKGAMRPRGELMASAGYPSRPGEFEELLRILDKELRLVSPSDQEGTEGASGRREPHYQLTHDYLVPSLREWLTRKQKETRRGRAELRLADRAALWNAKSEVRHLPGWTEWARIRLFTRRRTWTGPQRRMMRRADRHYAVRAMAVGLLLTLLAWAGWDYHGRMKAEALRDRLQNADTAEVPKILEELPRYKRWTTPLLVAGLAEARAAGDAKRQLNFSLALLSSDPGQVDYLYERMLSADVVEFGVIRTALLPHRAELADRLWAELKRTDAGADRRFRTACALAAYAPEDPRWEWYDGEAATRLVNENAMVLRQWAVQLQEVGDRLLGPLAKFLEEEGRDDAQRRAIVQLYLAYAKGRPEAFERLTARSRELTAFVGPPSPTLDGPKRQANLAAALIAMGRWESVRPVLTHSPDPTVRSLLIERLGWSTDVGAILARIDGEPEVSVRRALVLALGSISAERMPPADRERVSPWLRRKYLSDPDPGLRAAAGWVLGSWGQDRAVRDLDQQLAAEHREHGLRAQRQWYVNRLAQTYVVVSDSNVVQGGHLDRRPDAGFLPFAVAATEVTLDDYRRFDSSHVNLDLLGNSGRCPVFAVSWYKAAEYCNWLSKQDGITDPEELCYLPNDRGKFAAGMRVAANHRQRKGYRLPTEAEWIIACRAGARTEYACGGVDDELMSKYAWWLGNSHVGANRRSHPVGTRKPNDWGLFDMHGNAAELCHDGVNPNGSTSPSAGVELRILDDPERATKGGTYFHHFIDLGASPRVGMPPADTPLSAGFRPVRTMK